MLLKIFLLVQLSYLQHFVYDFHFLLFSPALQQKKKKRKKEKKENPCTVHELINLIIISSYHTVMTEQKVSIGL